MASEERQRSEAHLAPVSYLPGVQAPEAHTADAQEAESHEAQATAQAADKKTRRAENVSLAGLSRRNMSRWEVEKLLRSRELDDDVIGAEVARLEGVGLIDDAALAETLVRTQQQRKGLGRQAIVSELRRRHIEQDVIDAALEGLDADDERERAYELAEKRAGQLSSYDRETAKRRLTGFLMRKGYSSAIVRDAVDAALGPARGGATTVRFR